MTPSYAIRPLPVPEESAAALRIERSISAVQGEQLEAQGAWRIRRDEEAGGLLVQQIVERLARVTERPALPYRTHLYPDDNPNAVALADGRIYLSTGMLDYLASRGSREDEFAFILGHELAHTVAQHLVKRYRMLQRRQLLMSIVAAGTSAIIRDASAGIRQAGRLVLDAASLLQDVANSGYSQEQELEADQLAVRYMIRAGFDPEAVLPLLRDFSRFENPWPFLRTHPYFAKRHEDLARYLAGIGRHASSPPPRPATRPSPTRRRVMPNDVRQDAAIREPQAEAPMRRDQAEGVEQRREELRKVQQLYPKGSISWTNLQRQLEALSLNGATAQ